jgi:trimeric autotransporter adhesin
LNNRTIKKEKTMKIKLVLTLFAIFVLLLPGSSNAAAKTNALTTALGTAITYQGRLTDGGVSANGTYDFQFTLYNAEVGGAQVGSLVTKGDVPVSEGYFTVQLDFGAGAFGSEARWLEVAVRPGASTGTYTVLSPRQALTPAPFSLYAPTAGNTDLLDGLHSSAFALVSHQHSAADITSGTLSTDRFSAYADLVAESKIGSASGQVAAGIHQHSAADITSGTLSTDRFSAYADLVVEGLIGSANGQVAAGNHTHPTWNLTGNAGTNPSGNYLGTSDNQAFEIRVNGQRALRLEPNATSPNIIGGYSGNWITAGVYSATISGGGSSGFANRVTDNGGTVGGGADNQAGDNTGTTGDAEVATVGGGLGNTASGYYSTVSGGTTNTAYGSQAVIGGGGRNQAVGNLSTIAGGAYNLAQADFATISGGGPLDNLNPQTTNNRVFDQYGTIGGGADNRAGSDDGNTSNSEFATVGGGQNNTASGANTTVAGGGGNVASVTNSTVGGGIANQATYYAAVVAGGWSNLASGENSTVAGGGKNTASGLDTTVGGGYTNTANATYATVGGGNTNQATYQAATVAGGWVNVASGNASTVPGGANNEASGAYSFAAGGDAHATHDGSFVWSSASRTDSWGVQTFTVRAPGGARFYTASGTGTGVQLAAGGGSWSSLSDRNAKFNFSPVNATQVLEKVAALPLSTWSYRSQDASILHMGPMAQDFSAAFGLGEDAHYIGTLDADGVALASIQGLYRLSQQQAAEIRSLKAQLSQRQTSGSPQTTSSFPLIWVVVGLLGLSQVGMFLALRRRMGGRS